MSVNNLRIAVLPFQTFAGTTSTSALSASTTKTGVVFTARKTMTVTRLGFAFTSKTGTPPVYKISLQSVNASGVPDGTILGASNSGYATFDPGAFSNNSLPYFNLAGGVSVIAGQMYAMVLEYSSGTINASNLMTTAYVHNGAVTNADIAYGYALTNAGSWSKVSGSPLFLYGPSDDAFGLPFNAARATASFTNSTAMGLKFAIPAPFIGAKTYRLRGLTLLATPAAGDVWTVSLYQGGGASDYSTVLDTASIDTDCFVSSTATVARQIFFPGATADLPVLTFGDTYRLGFLNSDTTSHTLYTLPLTYADDVRALRLGDTFCHTTRAGGNWTDDTVRVPMVYELFLEDVQAARPRSVNCGGGFN